MALKRFLNGISDVSSVNPLGQLPFLDPTKWAVWFEDFLHYDVAQGDAAWILDVVNAGADAVVGAARRPSALPADLMTEVAGDARTGDAFVRMRRPLGMAMVALVARLQRSLFGELVLLHIRAWCVARETGSLELECLLVLEEHGQVLTIELRSEERIGE